MKKIISVFLTVALAGSVALAQNNKADKKRGDWREKVRAEQVANITSQLDLTEAEAQAFWPVYIWTPRRRPKPLKPKPSPVTRRYSP